MAGAGALDADPMLADISIDLATNADALHTIANAALKRHDRAVVAFSVMTCQLDEMRRLTQKLRTEGGSRFTIIAGGPHVTACPEEIVDAGADIVFCGEAELTFPKAIKNLADGNASPKIIRSPAQVDIESFVSISPKRGMFGPIEITRGCAFACNYCQTSRMFGTNLLIGKFLGLAFTLLVNVGVMAAVLYAVLAWMWWTSPENLRAACANDLRAPVTVDVHKLWSGTRASPHPGHFGHLPFGLQPASRRELFRAKMLEDLNLSLVELSDEEMKKFYDEQEKMAKAAGRPLPPYEQVKDQIAQYMERPQMQAAQQAFVEKLKKDMALVVNLKPPRVEVATDAIAVYPFCGSNRFQ